MNSQTQPILRLANRANPRWFLLGLMIAVMSNPLHARNEDLYLRATFTEGPIDLPYYFNYAVGYTEGDQLYPLVVHIHGAGERGTDNWAQVGFVGKLITQTTTDPFKAFVLAPQCPPGSSWGGSINGSDPANSSASAPMQSLMLLIEDIIANYPVDPQRIYVEGYSMGGRGTFDIIYRHPDWFAAASPIAGSASTSIAQTIQHLPLWVIHGENDYTVRPEGSIEIVNTLRDLGSDVIFSLIPDRGHDLWEATKEVTIYNGKLEPDWLHWMFAQSKTFQNQAYLGEGWLTFENFGPIYTLTWPWIYHSSTGEWWGHPIAAWDGFWVYRHGRGWSWFRDDWYPWIYDSGSGWTTLGLE